MRNVWIVMGTIFLAMGGAVSAGPWYEAAMEIIREGEAISTTGNLDAAMARYDEVAVRYPDETVAVAWASYYYSDCLLAGWRPMRWPFG